MILFCGVPSESPLRLAIDAAIAGGIEYRLLDQRRLADDHIALELFDDRLTGTLTLGGQQYALDDFDAIYSRMMDPLLLAKNARIRADQIDRMALFTELLSDWTELAEARVVNRPSAMVSNVSKPYQSQLIRPFFAVPPTLVTNDPDEVLAFEAEHGTLIYKSTSCVRSIVRTFDDAARKRLDQVRSLPTQFQAQIAGTDLRVHVIGNEVFATEITSVAVDYRYAARDDLDCGLRACTLAPSVEERCIALAAALELPFCGIDLRRTPDGTFVCFEVNPMPAYSYYQLEADQPIAAALVRYLDGGRSVATARRPDGTDDGELGAGRG